MDNYQITPHFSLFDLTKTLHSDMEEENRCVSSMIQSKITRTAQLLEDCWDIVGPFEVTSGFRCPMLNKRVGGQPNSQHLRGEAADFIPWGNAIESAFDKLSKAARAKYFEFGQLIFEEVENGTREGKTIWIHVSLGAPWREPAKCGQIFKTLDGKTVRG